jgi:hypothetical protein
VRRHPRSLTFCRPGLVAGPSRLGLRRLVAAVSLAAALGGCGADDPAPIFSVRPAAIDLLPVSYADATVPWTPFTVLNETYFPLTLERFAIEGDDGLFLEFDIPIDEEIFVRDSLTLRTRVATDDLGSRTAWRTGDFGLTIRLFVSGSGKTAVEGGWDPSRRVEVTVDVPVSFAINCDLDGDTVDARACGGADCNDERAGISPLVDETCDDLTDNNCDGRIDEGC